MSEFRYGLVVLTHGDGETLEDCLDSFRECVSPLPERLAILRDGPGYSFIPSWNVPFTCSQIAEEQVGFCRATEAAWSCGARSDFPYIFHLEHDFIFGRDVDLTELAAVLDGDPMLAQLSLCRDAATPRERRAGGLVEARPHDFPPQPGGWRLQPYLTTNPSLMRREFRAENPWPNDGLPNCEGRFGIELARRGYHFGMWGDGSVYVRHVGVRSGHGY